MKVILISNKGEFAPKVIETSSIESLNTNSVKTVPFTEEGLKFAAIEHLRGYAEKPIEPEILTWIIGHLPGLNCTIHEDLIYTWDSEGNLI